MDSRPTPGTTGKTAADTYATIAKFLELELESIESVKDSMIASLKATETGASATVDALKAQALSMRQQAIGAIVSGVTSLATTAGSFIAPHVGGISGELKANKAMQADVIEYQGKLQAKIPQPTAIAAPVGAGGTPAEAPSGPLKTAADFERDHANKMTATDNARFKENLDEYGPLSKEHIEAAHALSAAKMKELKTAEKFLEQKSEMIRNIGNQIAHGSGKAAESGGQFAAAATKTEEAQAEQSKQIQAALAEQMRQGVETLKRILDTYLQAETALQQLLKTTNQR